MIHYKLFQSKSKLSGCKDKWFAKSYVEETYDTAKLSNHMASHHTPFSPGVIKGVLEDMISCIKELLLDGKNVKLDNLAIFTVGIKSKGADTAKDFDITKNVKNVRLRARATGELSTAKLKLDASLQSASEYKDPKKDSTGSTGTNTSTTGDGKDVKPESGN